MRLLHTSDWHVGKKIRGHSRADEHRAVLAEIVAVAAESEVDLVVVAGDLYETAAPAPESERIVNDALLALAEVAPVLAVAGNHDNPRRLAAVESLMRLGRITMVSEIRAPNEGGVVELTVGGNRTGATPVRAAMVPFVSQRAIIRAQDLMGNAAFENAQRYGERMLRVIDALCAGFDTDHVNLVVGHAFVHGAQAGGGERPTHLVDEYALSAVDFPPTASYVALGHLHRAQQMLGATSIHYCGSPLQLDFGEQDQAKQVNLVTLEPGLPAKVDAVPLRSGRRLRTVTGTLAQIEAWRATGGDIGGRGEIPAGTADAGDRADTGDRADGPSPVDLDRDWLRVKVTEANRAGLADEVRELLGPRVVDIRVESPITARPTRARGGRTPNELFASYLAEHGVDDPALRRRFAGLLDQVENADRDDDAIDSDADGDTDLDLDLELDGGADRVPGASAAGGVR